MDRYAALSGRDLATIDYYLTFAYFKLAAILQQIYARWHRGNTRDERFADFGERVRVLIDMRMRGWVNPSPAPLP